MVEVKRIRAPSDLPSEGSYVLVLYGPSAMDRGHPRGRTLIVPVVNQIRTYLWCNPPKIGRQRMGPAR
jgi:hypothetical protein